MRWVVGVGMLSCLGLGGCAEDPFGCGDDDQCGGDGLCEANGYCSFPDTTCPSGRRYGELAGGGLANVCVTEGDAGSTGGSGQSQTSTSGTSGTSTSSGSATSGTSSSSDGSTGEPPVACIDDAECSDGLACNGEETCGPEGFCVDGIPPCPEAPENCVGCQEGVDGADCTVAAADADDDGFGSMACAEAPGDDCADDDSSVFPGAEEVCDGLDNDCNGLTEMDEGASLYGTPSLISGGFFVDVAYSDADQVYGLAYEMLPMGRRFTAFDLAQTQVVAPMAFPEDAADRVFLEYSGETFVAVYRREGDFMTRQGINADGFVSAASGVDSTGGVGFHYGAGEFSDGGLAVAWDRPSTFAVRLLAPDLSPIGTTVTTSVAEARRQPRIAQSGTTIGMVWGGDAAEVAFYSQDLEELSSAVLTDSPGSSIYGSQDIVQMGDGFGIAYVTGVASQRVEYVEYEADGTLRCGPVTLADPGNARLHDLDAHEGVAAAFLTSGEDWVLRRMRVNCEPLEEPVVIESVPFYGENGSIDINASGVGIATQIFDDGGGDTARISFRALGPNLCDAPVGR
ncbi:MAG: putative metal-binding motif-containing protein [Myxococcota bacterium]